MRIEQFLAVEFYSVRDADVAQIPAFAGGTDRLHHRLLSPNTFQNRVRTDSLSQLLDAGHALITTLGHDVGRSDSRASFCRDA